MRLLQISALTVALTTASHAGVLIVEKTEQLGKGGTTGTSKVSIGDEDLKMETTNTSGGQLMLYKGAEDTLYIVDLKKGVYHKLTKQQLEQMMNQVGDQIAQMKAMMDEKLKDMPPKQREMVENMMKGRMSAMGGAEPVKTIYRKVASGEAVGQWQCDKYEGLRGQEKMSDVWTTDWSDFGMSVDDFRVFTDLADMFSGLASKLGTDFPQMGAATPSEGQFAGMPVRRISYRDGKAYQRHEVQEVTRMDFGPDVFTLPDGLREEKMPGLERFSAPAR